MNTKNVIDYISFLFQGSRLRVRARRGGTFRIPVKSGKLKYKDFTAREVILYEQITSGDPVLTLKSGEKVRVFQGGDNSYLVPEADGVLLKHDARETHRREKERVSTQSRYELPWEDLGDFDF